MYTANTMFDYVYVCIDIAAQSKCDTYSVSWASRASLSHNRPWDGLDPAVHVLRTVSLMENQAALAIIVTQELKCDNMFEDSCGSTQSHMLLMKRLTLTSPYVINIK